MPKQVFIVTVDVDESEVSGAKFVGNFIKERLSYGTNSTRLSVKEMRKDRPYFHPERSA